MKIEWRLASFVERGCNSQGVGCGWDIMCVFICCDSHVRLCCERRRKEKRGYLMSLNVSEQSITA